MSCKHILYAWRTFEPSSCKNNIIVKNMAVLQPALILPILITRLMVKTYFKAPSGDKRKGSTFNPLF